MTTAPSRSPLESAAARVTLVMSCLFATTGVVMVFLPRWLEDARGLDGAAIGAVLSLAQFGRVAVGPMLAFWTDDAPDRRRPLRLIASAAFVSYLAFFFLAYDFVSLLVLGFIALSLTQGLTPLVEAATLRATASGRFNYGFARGVGSVAFIVANVAGGMLVARFGVGAIATWVLSSMLLTAVSTVALRPDPSPAKTAPAARGRVGAVSALLKSRRFLLLIVACGLIQSSHGFYYGFSTLVWRGQGLTDAAIGYLWALGVAVEVSFLWTLAYFERRVSPEAMIIAGGLGGAFRWLLMGFAPLGPVLWPLQALHALSFAAAHVGAMRLVYREASETSPALAQTLYSATSAGVFMGVATLVSGVLYDHFGAGGYWAMALTAAAGAILALQLLAPKKRG